MSTSEHCCQLLLCPGIIDDKMERDSNCICKFPGLEKTWGFKSEDLHSCKDNEKRTLLCPETPCVERENVKPSTSIDASLPSTPESHVFDPFAPGPEEMALAPRKKRSEESHPCVVRRLLFDCNINSAERMDEDSEISFMENMYSLVMDILLANADEESDSSSQLSQLDLLEGCKTPPSLPTLSWISDTCPGAPVKSSQRHRQLFSPSLCRKLSFES